MSRWEGSDPGACHFNECLKEARAVGLCWGHYDQHRSGQALQPLRVRRPSNTAALRDERGRKHCFGCNRWLELARFPLQASKGDGYSPRCKECRRWLAIQRNYGLSKTDFEALVENQGGLCAICEQPQTVDTFVVDHDHACCSDRGRSCGRCVRGLLCSYCNTAIGSLRDDPKILHSAIRYLDSVTP